MVGMSQYSEEAVRLSPGFSDDNAVFRCEVSAVLSAVREELDDHRQAINENTNEVESHIESIAEISRRIDALQERIDALIHHNAPSLNPPVVCRLEPLTNKEKRVFSAMYASLEEAPEVSYRQLSARLGMSEEVIAGYITNLMEKGIPVKKRYVNSMVRLSLEQRFRQEQAKGNLVRLDHPLTSWL